MMTRKSAGKQDYTVSRLEGQWFFAGDPAKVPPDQWQWKLLIRTPDFIRPSDLKQAVATLRKKGKAPEAMEVTLETLDEGTCVQMLHVGPYDREGETVSKMGAFAQEHGFRVVGPHHEIYISDPRRVPPERLKTILRQPVTTKQTQQRRVGYSTADRPHAVGSGRRSGNAGRSHLFPLLRVFCVVCVIPCSLASRPPISGTAQRTGLPIPSPPLVGSPRRSERTSGRTPAVTREAK